MENLKIYGGDGKVLLERDLAGEKGPLMILAGAKPLLVDAVPQGSEVLGALLRDEDGWILASARPGLQVVSGSKRAQDGRLAAGIACALGDWAFRLDATLVSNGPVLLWRSGSGPVTAERLVQGKNTVVRQADGSFAVNPPVSGGEVACEMFPTSGGIDVVTVGAGAQRLQVARNTLFAVGAFQAMSMDAQDAAEAVKSGSPFSWPARGTRAALLAGLLAAGAVFLGAAYVARLRGRAEAALAAKTGAVASERRHEPAEAQFTDEDVTVYNYSFMRSLPLVLKGERSPVTRDLIARGRQLSGRVGGANAAENERSISEEIRFLEAVDAIQAAVHRGDWEGLKATLASADRKAFVAYDADVFYADAVEVADFVTGKLPAAMSVASAAGSAGMAEVGRRIEADFEALSDNIFMSGEVVRRERDSAAERWRALTAYIPARDAFSAGKGGEAALVDAWANFVEAFEGDPSLEPLVARERETLSEAVLRLARTADDVSLISLCALGEAVGIDDARIGEWRRRAAAARKGLSERYRALYSDYRMRAAVAPAAPETLAVLDQMVALGLEDNAFHQWALREKARVQSPAGAAEGNGEEKPE